MIKRALIAGSVSLALVSTALAVPISPTPQPGQDVTSDLVQVKKHYKNYKHRNYKRRHYKGRYRYGNRNWGHRYNYAPSGWRARGCIGGNGWWYCG
jgi:hypothetical protein